jgi:hypothetical protein
MLLYCPCCVLSRSIVLLFACSNSVSLTRLSTERKFIYLSRKESVSSTELRMILCRQVFQYLLERVIWTCTLEAVQIIGDTVTRIYYPIQQCARISCILIRSCCVCSKAIKEKLQFSPIRTISSYQRHQRENIDDFSAYMARRSAPKLYIHIAGLHPQSSRHFARKTSAGVSQNLRSSYISHMIPATT